MRNKRIILMHLNDDKLKYNLGIAIKSLMPALLDRTKTQNFVELWDMMLPRPVNFNKFTAHTHYNVRHCVVLTVIDDFEHDRIVCFVTKNVLKSLKWGFCTVLTIPINLRLSFIWILIDDVYFITKVCFQIHLNFPVWELKNVVNQEYWIIGNQNRYSLW